MPEVGVRELKARASEILRAVRESRTRYVVTHRGRPVGVLVPLDEVPRQGEPTGTERADAWDALTALGEQISRAWQSDSTAVELLSELRR